MITVNGEKMELAMPIALPLWLNQHNINTELVAVEHNQVLLTREQYSTTEIKDGDNLEIVRFVGGG